MTAVELSVVTQAVERLAGLDGLSRVLHALDASAVDRMMSRKPTVIVYPLADDASDSVAPEIGAIQTITSTIAVMHLIQSPNDPGGTSAHVFDRLSEALGATRTSLNGWKPAVGGRQRNALILRRGRLASVDGSGVLWVDSYELEWAQENIQP